MSQQSSVLIPHLYQKNPVIILLIVAIFIVSTLFSAAITVFAAGTLTVHVYTDTNRNGLDDDGPGNGIAGVLVSVYTADSVLIGLNTTDNNGDVVFPALPDGEYRIEVSNLGARVVSVPGAGNAGLLSFVTISGSAVTQRVGLRPATPTDNDAPIGTRSVVARVWDDRDADGIQDAGEPGLSSIPVTLIDSLGNLVAGPVNTDSQGRAIFNTAPTGAGYRLRILAANIPSGYILTQAFVNDGAPNPGIRDSDAVLVGGNVEATLPNTGRGVNIDNIDIGFARGAVSGFVWRDTNRNGLWDPGEPRLNGVQVQLLNTTTSMVVDTATTRQRLGSSEPSDGGIFVFTGIPLGATYQVVIPASQFATGAPLFGAANSPNASGGDVGSPDGVPSGDVTGPSFSLAPGSNTRNDQLFGFYKGVVGDYVWLDDNGNGSPDSGEIGVNGVIVFVDDGRGGGTANNGIRDGGEISTVTTNNPSNGQPGYYSFDDLPLGASYRIVLDESNFLPGGALVGLGNSTGTKGTNGNGNTYVYRDSSTLNPLPPPEDTNVDFGLTWATISGIAFFDANNDGMANSGEPRMRNVTVELLNASSVVVNTQSTSTTGTYTFAVLPGTYTVRFTNPDTGNYVFITGGDSSVTTPGAVSNSSTVPLTVPYNGSLTNINAGFRGQTTVSGRIFEDNNGDNLQNAGDTDLAGATVTLTVTARLANLVATYPATLTTSPPNYQFTGLPGGTTGTITYTVTFTPPTGGYIASDANIGGDDTIDSDGPTITVTGPTPGGTLDFDQGYYRNVTITARVFREPSAGRNNQWNTGETGIAGVTVRLERTDNTLVTTATTDSNGLVTFTARPGSYQLNVDESSPALSGLQPSSGSTAAIPVVGSPLSSGGSSLTETSPPGTTHVFGFFTFGTVSGRVFFDGKTDPADNLATGEPGVSGVTVRLLDAGGNPISGKTATTDSNGNFTITDVEGGTYRLEFVNPAAANFSFVAANTGDNNVATIVSDNGRTDTFTVTDGQTTTRNAAIIGRSTVNGVTFVDQAYDGQRVGDPGLAGVTVTLNATINLSNVSTTITRTTTSDSNGIFSFTGLPGGTSTSEASFSLTFTPPSATPPYQVTLADQGDDATDSDGTAELTNQPIGINTTASRDQGYYQNVTIRARVFNETVTINNSFESGEPGLRAVSVSVSGPVSGSQVTDLSGIVTFNGPPGTYTFTVPTDPSGYLRSPGNSGTASTGLVLSGQTPDPVPFGYYRPAQISGTVWFDVNRNGLFDSGEPGMENISVTLNGNSSGPLPPVTTDGSGSFTITNIEPTGLTNTSYQLCFALPAGFAFTSLGDTLTTDNNSDANLTTGCTSAFSVASDANITYLDAGMVGTLSIGDLVWEDMNANGIQESGEQALDGVTITVTVATTGNVINATNPSFTFSTTSTTATGLAPNYTIDNIPPGSTVTIQSVSRFGYVLSPANQGSNSSVDSNAIGESITLTTSNTTIDFGLYRTTAIGNLVWFDANGNGLRDTGEPGIGGITVALRNSSGSTVTTTTTLGDGSYAFNNVTPGTYSLQITLPAGYTTTNNGSGSITVDDDNDFRTDGTTANFTILSGQALGSIDAGLRGTGGVSGIAWFDTNENNQRDSAETERLAGVQVTITYTPTLLAAYEQTVQTTTDTNGAYSVTGLPPGQVTVTFTDRNGYLPAQSNVGDDATDSDGPGVTFTLTAGQQAVVDMGYYKRVLVYLPMTIVQIPPDLIVTVQATPTSPNKNTPVTYRVTVTNVGREPAGNFWVDLYVNPSRPPNVNERWNDLSRQGLAWFFDGTLQPGESVTLISLPRSTTNPLGYDPGTSSPTWNGRLPPGRNTIYVYVDSWNRSITGDVVSPFGAVEEVNETNNRAEIMIMVSE
ncbi:MAG: collagen-binding protein [Chloroflexus sp.]|uniref:SdrD B-like domain-containing protein n=1 Tax=Chloroflexus sp. TaxID=1904827 RepID=UPI0021DE2CCB|nr:SdrD B-like domain-containing protein [Chloroflexus sp.]GIV89344.1 MAG: collagen-binding protein [Chloroflexus sp.]